MDDFWGVVWALAPTVLVGLIFWYVMRALVKSDKKERKIAAKIEAQERARFEAEQKQDRANPVR